MILPVLALAVLAGALVLLLAPPVWLGALLTRLLRRCLPWSVTVGAVAPLQIRALRLAVLDPALALCVGSATLQLLPPRLTVADLRLECDPVAVAGSVPSRPPPVLARLLPYVVAVAVKLLAFVQIAVYRIRIQATQPMLIDGVAFPQFLSVDSVEVRGAAPALQLRGLHAQSHDCVLTLPTVHAHLLAQSATASSIHCLLFRQISVAVGEVRADRTQLALHVVAVRHGVRQVAFLGHGSVTDFRTPRISLLGLRLSVDNAVRLLPLVPPLPPSPPTFPDFSLHLTDCCVSAADSELFYVEEGVLNKSVVQCRNLRAVGDRIRINAVAVLTGSMEVSVEAAQVDITADFAVTDLLLPMAQLALQFPSVESAAQPSTPPRISVRTGQVRVRFPHDLSVGLSTVSVAVSVTGWQLTLRDARCLHFDQLFLSVRHVTLSGTPPNPETPHKRLLVAADRVRGNWTAPMQLDLLRLVKETVGVVIACKAALFPLLFPSANFPRKRPAKFPIGLPNGDEAFLGWAFGGRAPYLAEDLLLVGLAVTDLVLTADLAALTVAADRFASDFLPWHWQISGLAVCVGGFPALVVESVEVERMLAASVTAAALQTDPLLSDVLVLLLQFAPIRILLNSVNLRLPPYPPRGAMALLARLRAFFDTCLALPTLEEHVRGHGGPGYIPPPPLTTSPRIHLRVRNVAVSLLDSPWDAWLHHTRPVGLDERVAADARRELLRLKIREHQRRTGRLLSDAQIALMSTRLAETNFDLYRARIARLRAAHRFRWRFPPRAGVVLPPYGPGDFRLGPLLSLSIAELDVEADMGRGAENAVADTVDLAVVDCAVRAALLQIQLRQFAPPVADIAHLATDLHLRVSQSAHGPTHSVALPHGPLLLPLSPPLLSLQVRSAAIARPTVVLAPCLLRTAQDVGRRLSALRPVFLDAAVRALSVLDLARYLVTVDGVRDVSVTDLECCVLRRMPTTGSVTGSALVVTLPSCRLSYLDAFHIEIDQVTVGFRNADTGATADAVRMSTESAAAPPSPPPASDLDADLYDPGLLLQAYSVTVSATVRFLSVHGTPCASRWVYTPPRTADPFSPFRADRAILDLSLCCGSPQRQTKLLFNAKHVPGMLLLLGRSPWRMPCPDLSRVDVEGARLTVRHAAFTLLDAESAAEPGQGLRLSLAEMEAEFGLRHGTIHRASLSVAHVQGTLVANGAFYRKCETGHELSHEIRTGTVVVVHTYENQRFILGQGWLSRLLPTDRPSWSDGEGLQDLPRHGPAFALPNAQWRWECDWIVDRGQLAAKVDADGWQYAHDFPRAYSPRRHWTDNVRRRRWFRIRRLKDAKAEKPRRPDGVLFLLDSVRISQRTQVHILPPRTPSDSGKQPMSLLAFFAIGQKSPTPAEKAPVAEKSPPRVTATTTSPYLFTVKVVNPKARLTLESRNSLVQLFRVYLLHFDYYARLRSAPAQSDLAIGEDAADETAAVPSADEISDDDNNDENDEAILAEFAGGADDDAELPAALPTPTPAPPDSDAINPVALLDLVSIEVANGQMALESSDEGACGILLAVMESCLITARSFADEEAGARLDLRLLVDNLALRLAPTDIDLDAGLMWFDFQPDSVIKPIVDSFPIQASAVLYPTAAIPHNLFFMLPSISANLDSSQCALLESILTQVVLADLPLAPGVRTVFAGCAGRDGRRTDHQRILWQVRHLEWLLGVFSAGDDDAEMALLMAHLTTLRQQYVESVLGVGVPARLPRPSVAVHLRVESVVLALLLVNRVEFLRLALWAGTALAQLQFAGEGAMQLACEIRDLRALDTRRTDPDDWWRPVLVPVYQCGPDTVAHENRVVMTLQVMMKRVGGISVICSCVLNVAHLVVRLTQALADEVTEFVTHRAMSETERRLLQTGARLVPKASGVLSRIETPPATVAAESAGEGAGGGGGTGDESARAPSHLRDLRLYSGRSQNSVIITYLRIGAIRVTISFKGSGAGGLADFQGVRVRMPAVVYQKKTWTAAKFARRLRRDLIRAALRQAGPGLASFLRYKFGGSSVDVGAYSAMRSYDDLTTLDIDLPIGSIPIQPSPHPIAKGKAVVNGLMTKLKTSVAQSAGDPPPPPPADPDKRRMLLGSQKSFDHKQP